MPPNRWNLLKDVFSRAQNVNPGQIRAFFDVEFKKHPELRTEVEHILWHSDAPESFPLKITSTWPKWPLNISGSSSLSAGDVIASRFRIEQLIGAGGMGEVYRARDCRLLRLVAVKLLSPRSFYDDKAHRYLEREARAVAGLLHPHICALYHFDTDTSERDYLVLEYVEGDTLASRLRAGPMPTSEWLQIADEVGGALAYAHRHGVIHRDLKPSNILLSAEGSKLIDFGLAAANTLTRLPDSSSMPTQTQEGMVVGTVSYMSPEQAEGKQLDPRTDIFSFGCVLYEMVTGRKAFYRQSAVSTLTAVLYGEPEPIHTLVRSAPEALSGIVRKCLSKNPEHRFENMEEVCKALRKIDVRSGRNSTAALAAAGQAFRISAVKSLWRQGMAKVQEKVSRCQAMARSPGL